MATLSNKISLVGIGNLKREDVKEFIRECRGARIRVEIPGSGWHWVISENDLIERAGENLI